MSEIANQKNVSTNPVNNTKPKGSFTFPSLSAHIVYWPIVVIGVVADLWSKATVHDWLSTLPDQAHVFINGYFRFVLRTNDGAAFSMFKGQTAILITISAVALLVVLGLFFFGQVRTRLLQVALALFTAGIIGNLYDRAFNEGFVRDFIDVVIPLINYRWPAFNVADSMLCVAVGLILIHSFTSSSSQTPVHPQK
ncbi:MAG: signal peptidase II [Sedimentisphaerales bacterium]|nr:signal peptidase II [Sedimentisphaerales bacterium]